MKGYRYSLRFALDPETDTEQRIEALLDFCEKAKIDDVMFFIGAEDLNCGHITAEESVPYMEAILRAGGELKKRGITVSLNPWQTLGHGDRGRTLKRGQDFGRMVDCEGTRAALVACPLSEKWREYFVGLLRFYAQSLRPETLWLEDDFRLNNHEPLKDGGCFCPAHMRLYAEELGEEVTRGQFVRGVAENEPGYRAAYLRANRRAMRGTLACIVGGLEGVQDKFGLMTSDAAGYMAEGRDQRELFRILSSRAPALDRITLGSYRQSSPLAYAWQVNAKFMLARAMADGAARVVGEIENFPMTLFSKSARFTAFQTEMSLPLCLEGQTLDLFEFNGNGVCRGEGFARELAARKEYFAGFAAQGLRFSSLSGVAVLVSSAAPLYKKRGEGLSRLIPEDTFFAGLLGCLGISFYITEDAAPKGKTVAVGGEVLRCFSDDEIVALFENNFVLLSGTSLSVLCERGLAERCAGVREIRTLRERSGAYSYEQCVREGLGEIPQERASCQYFAGDFCLVRYAPQAETEEYTAVFRSDGAEAGTGICTVGGRVCILPYTETEYPVGLLSPLRGRALYRAVREGGFAADVVHTPCENVSVYLFRAEECDVLVGCNYSDDGYPSFPFGASREYRRAEYFTAQERGREAALLRREGGYELAAEVPPSASFYVRLYRD